MRPENGVQRPGDGLCYLGESRPNSSVFLAKRMESNVVNLELVAFDGASLQASLVVAGRARLSLFLEQSQKDCSHGGKSETKEPVMRIVPVERQLRE